MDEHAHDHDFDDSEAPAGRRRSPARRAAWRATRADLEAAVKQARELAEAERRRADLAEASARTAWRLAGWR